MLAVLNFLRIFSLNCSLSVLNQKYCYSSLLSKQYEVFACPRAAGSYSLYVLKREAKCTLLMVQLKI